MNCPNCGVAMTARSIGDVPDPGPFVSTFWFCDPCDTWWREKDEELTVVSE